MRPCAIPTAAVRLALLSALASCSKVAPTTPTSYQLTLSTTGTGSGTLSASPSGPNYDAGTVVTVAETPAAGSTFTGWSGACSGTTACSVTMNASESVVATFAAAETFRGTFSGGSFGSFSTPTSACTLEAFLSGTQTVLVTENGDGTVTGVATSNLSITGDVVSGANCTFTPGAFSVAGSVIGGDAALTWKSGNALLTFTGARSASTILGTLAVTEGFTATDQSGSKSYSLTATIPNVSLTKQTSGPCPASLAGTWVRTADYGSPGSTGLVISWNGTTGTVTSNPGGSIIAVGDVKWENYDPLSCTINDLTVNSSTGAPAGYLLSSVSLSGTVLTIGVIQYQKQ